MLYPLMLDVKGKECIVFGGGRVAERKLKGVMDCGAAVTVVSPEISDRLYQLHLRGSIKWIKDNYDKGYLKNAFICFACTDDAEINMQIADHAREKEILVNVSDSGSSGSFVVPSVRRREGITLAIYSDENPGASRYLSESLVNSLEEWQLKYITLIKHLRRKCKKLLPNPGKRQSFISSLYAKDYTELAQKDFGAVEESINKRLDQLLRGSSHE